jgi:hypothetical protein
MTRDERIEQAARALVECFPEDCWPEVTALQAALAPTPEPVPGIRRCPDCGSVRFNRDGARALDEARSEGFRQGVEEAAKECDGVVRHAARKPHREMAERLAAAIRSLSPTAPPEPKEEP